ncbi:hypothetical protein AWZ03_014750, partial [Drosophila navojoa]
MSVIRSLCCANMVKSDGNAELQPGYFRDLQTGPGMVTLEDLVAKAILAGRGCFRSYLKRIGHEKTEECPWCGRGHVEDTKHILFECGRSLEERRRLEEAMDHLIRADNMVTWELISTFTAPVMTELRR